MHLKSYQIDGHLLRTGAANFSASGLKRQDNDLIVIKDMQAAAKFKHVFEASYGAALREIGLRDCMSKAYAPTTAPRTHISRSGGESERCRASNWLNLLSALFLFMRRSTTHSMFSGI